MGRRTVRVPAVRLALDTGEGARPRPDTVVVEEPLEIRVGGTGLMTTMRTPGDDFELALGWLLSEGVIPDAGSVAGMMHCTDVDESGSPTFNVVDVTLAPGVLPAPGVSARRTVTSSACGVCGTDSIDAILSAPHPDLGGDDTRVDPGVLTGLVDAMRTEQRTFDRTGGLHAAALFTADGELLDVREDVGRHNAVDKVLGRAAMDGLRPGAGLALAVSGRAGFELVQKCVMAGVPVMTAVSAPTSLSVDLATRAGLTLVAFLRPPHATVYSGGARLGLG